jgi:hypothetical protein
MILGIISFLLFIAELFNLFQSVSKLDEIGLDAASDMLSILHVVHICLFITMMCYILLVIFLYCLTNWNRSYPFNMLTFADIFSYWSQTEKQTIGMIIWYIIQLTL